MACVGSREQAYVFSLAGAILSHSVARACSLGSSNKCGCGRLPNEPAPQNFRWGGCGDDINYGVAFSRGFSDAKWARQKKSKRSLVNVHNAEVGRKVSNLLLWG
jgi:hypothetical protein